MTRPRPAPIDPEVSSRRKEDKKRRGGGGRRILRVKPKMPSKEEEEDEAEAEEEEAEGDEEVIRATILRDSLHPRPPPRTLSRES